MVGRRLAVVCVARSSSSVPCSVVTVASCPSAVAVPQICCYGTGIWFFVSALVSPFFFLSALSFSQSPPRRLIVPAATTPAQLLLPLFRSSENWLWRWLV
ncbi:hypothetical protein AAHE18_14G110300 [Arachis hypogaea]|nr:uncharacterized protein DS421_14g461860 [Arachis hypogaea]